MNLAQTKTITENAGYYFPLFNFKGIKSSITPFFAGDIKTDHHHYALTPTTEVDLFHLAHGRNVVFQINHKTYHLNGQTEHQQNDEIIYETDLLYQKVTRKNELFTIETTSFIPLDATIELHRITIINHSVQTLMMDVHTATPIYGRSADNLRDHRHVTSLLNRIEVMEHTILVEPTLSFDERGHQVNNTVYSLATRSNELNIKGYIPTYDAYVNGGSLLFPKGLESYLQAGTQIDGYEAFGGILYDTYELEAKKSVTLYLSIGIHDSKEAAIKAHHTYMQQPKFDQGLSEVSAFFYQYMSSLTFDFHSKEVSKQLGWVMLQPMLRRFFGNSYMPHHDYGRGGRGWRDLWQDCLALIMTNDPSVLDLLINNFAGVRIDGTNATIIGDLPGEFKADRNQITRVWSDHGAWPLLTLKMYIDETGDLDVLFAKKTYFSDQYTHYTKKTIKPPKLNILLDAKGNTYEGTILEHLLIQNLIGFHNIGNHGFSRLEDADWNDGLDMAHHLGETIAFTHMFANNLKILANLVEATSTSKIEVYVGLEMLFDEKVDLKRYFDDAVGFSGTKVLIEKKFIIDTLRRFADDRIKHLHAKAFLGTHYASYYDNEGLLLDQKDTVNLTGQTMALLNLIATKEQAISIATTTKAHLFSPNQGGYLLNTNYQKVLTNMGRAFGFAYGHKENGAMFSHMAIMYAYGLYQYDLIDFGHEGMMALLHRALHQDAKVWVGIPEYFNDQGVGKYAYLTGSASWLLKLLRTEVFGIQFDLGTLTLLPKLKAADFIDDKASITTYLWGKLTTLTYHNPKALDYGEYKIKSVFMNGQETTNQITQIKGNIEVYLDETI